MHKASQMPENQLMSVWEALHASAKCRGSKGLGSRVWQFLQIPFCSSPAFIIYDFRDRAGERGFLGRALQAKWGDQVGQIWPVNWRFSPPALQCAEVYMVGMTQSKLRKFKSD